MNEQQAAAHARKTAAYELIKNKRDQIDQLSEQSRQLTEQIMSLEREISEIIGSSVDKCFVSSVELNDRMQMTFCDKNPHSRFQENAHSANP